jgi:glycine cleavage system aminomethyltransferase T/glycine/D-amino acid oxidase-like deaminating enzyme
VSANLPTQARVVIVGGGIAGCSIAYHLAKLGWRDVVLLERGQLTCGTTWHAAGLVMQLRTTPTMTDLCRYGAEFLPKLEVETGQQTGFKQNGSLPIARTSDRLTEIKRLVSLGRYFGVEAHILSAEDAQRHYPLLDASKVVGGAFIPGDGQTNPVDTTQALAAGARKNGVKIFERVSVVGFEKQGGRIVAVETDRGTIACEIVVNCAGIWAPEIGRFADVNIPLYASEHMYVTTEAHADILPNLPVLRDTDGYVYVKEDAGKLLVGSFEPEAKPLPLDQLPVKFEFGELPEDWDHFELPMAKAMEMIPLLNRLGIRHFMNGPESFTPDNRFILGPAPEVPNFYVAAGFNSQGILSGPGVGKAMAEWIVEGEATMDLAEIDIARFHPFQSNKRYLKSRTRESVGLLYAMHWPYRQMETARPVRRSPLHDRVAARGACFGEVAGWERANWYAPAGVKPEYEYSYGRQNWHDYVGAEHRAVRERVAIFDQSSFAKYLVQGRDAAKVMQRLCANDVSVSVDKIVYTQFLNQRGGIEADVTVTRLAEDSFLVVTIAASQIRDFEWTKRNIAESDRVILTDVTSSYAVLGVMGPKSRELLSRLTPESLSNESFPFGTAKEIDFAFAKVRAHRLTYVGELGWELYIPSEFAVGVYDAIIEEGEAFDLTHAGYHAMDSLRLEKAYRHWGHDIGPSDTPLEAGLAFAVALDKQSDFIGRDALLRQRDDGVSRRLCAFVLPSSELPLFHNEPILSDNKVVGRITSGGYGHTVDAPIGLGYVNVNPRSKPSDILENRFEIEIAGERVSAEPHLRPPYDPKNQAIRA